MPQSYCSYLVIVDVMATIGNDKRQNSCRENKRVGIFGCLHSNSSSGVFSEMYAAQVLDRFGVFEKQPQMIVGLRQQCKSKGMI